MSAYTPWVVYENEVWTVRDDGEFGRPLFKSRMRDGISWGPAWPPGEEDKALALAASAPALLNVLTEIVEYAGGAENALHDEYVMDRVLAAIAKATGAA